MGEPIRVGLKVTWQENGKTREGVIRRIESASGYADGIERALVQPIDIPAGPNDPLWPLLKYTELRVPLHHGAFASDETPEDFTVRWKAAQAKIAEAVINGTLDRAQIEGASIPEEILNAIKQVIAVLGTEEAIRLILMLVGK